MCIPSSSTSNGYGTARTSSRCIPPSSISNGKGTSRSGPRFPAKKQNKPRKTSKCSVSSSRNTIVLVLSGLLVITLKTSLLLHTILVQDGNENYDSIFVISLDGVDGANEHNKGRFEDFKTKLAKACEGAGFTAPRVEYCPGVMDERRGYGLTKSWLGCLEKAKTMDLEVTVILEDDARLFDREESLFFCDAEKRRSQIWSGMPKDTFITFFGGHSWNYLHNTKEVVHSSIAKEDSSTENEPRNIQYRETIASCGTYGFAVPRQSLDLLLGTIRGDIAHGWIVDKAGHHIKDFLSPEKSWYNTAQRFNKKMYALQPLVVWHEGGFSNTWKRERGSLTGEGEEEEEHVEVKGMKRRGVLPNGIRGSIKHH